MTTNSRKPLTKYTGVVSSKCGDQTVKVILSYQVKHPKYDKIMKRRTVAHVHDQQNDHTRTNDVAESTHGTISSNVTVFW